MLIETHVREQEQEALLAEGKVAEYDAERSKLLDEAVADGQAGALEPEPGGMAPITEEDAGC